MSPPVCIARQRDPRLFPILYEKSTGFVVEVLLDQGRGTLPLLTLTLPRRHPFGTGE